MNKPIFDQASLAKIGAAQAAAREATALIPTLIPTEEGDHLLQTKVALDNAAILPGDWLVVRSVKTAEDGQIVIAHFPAGEYTVTRAPVREGLTLVALVIGLLRSLK